MSHLQCDEWRREECLSLLWHGQSQRSSCCGGDCDCSTEVHIGHCSCWFHCALLCGLLRWCCSTSWWILVWNGDGFVQFQWQCVYCCSLCCGDATDERGWWLHVWHYLHRHCI